MRLTSPILGAVVNSFIFGSADILVGQVGHGILKFILSLAYLIAGGWIVAHTHPQALSNWLSIALILTYTIIVPIDGYCTVVKANR